MNCVGNISVYAPEILSFDVIQIYPAKNKISNFGLVFNIFFLYASLYGTFNKADNCK